MSSLCKVVDITHGQVDRVVVMLASGDGDCCLITAQNDGHECCPFAVNMVPCNNILYLYGSKKNLPGWEWNTYCLIPCPVSWHEVLEAMVASLCIVFMKQSSIHLHSMLWVWEHIVDNLMWTSEPDIINVVHPWRLSLLIPIVCILYWETVPTDVPKLDLINFLVKFLVIMKQWLFSGLEQWFWPYVQKCVDLLHRHLIPWVQKISQFEFQTVAEWRSIFIGLWLNWHWRWSWQLKIALWITWRAYECEHIVRMLLVEIEH